MQCTIVCVCVLVLEKVYTLGVLVSLYVRVCVSVLAQYVSDIFSIVHNLGCSTFLSCSELAQIS